MVSPSKRSLQAAAIAGERREEAFPSTDEHASAEHLLKLASELKERIDVLRILDGTAPQWPGITNCIALLHDVAAQTSEALTNAHETVQKCTKHVEEAAERAQAQQIRADEAEDALAACNSENCTLTTDLEQAQQNIEHLKGEIADERLQKERKIDNLQGRHQESEKRAAALRAELSAAKEDLHKQSTELQSLRNTVAQQVDELVELREAVAGSKAALAAQARASAQYSAELTVTKRKLQDASTALAEAESRGASLTATVHALKNDVSREQAEVGRLKGELKVAREEAVRAKQWREAQVTVNNDKLQEAQAKSAEMQRLAERDRSELSKTVERLKAELRAAHDKAESSAHGLEQARRQCKVHELEARDAISKAQRCHEEAEHAREAASTAATDLSKATAHLTLLQQQLKDCQASISEREAAVRQQCDKAAAKLRSELSDARQELAVKAALAGSWEREVQQLCQRLEKLESEKEKLQDANSRMHQQVLMSPPKPLDPQPHPSPPNPPRGPVQSTSPHQDINSEGAVNELRYELRALACQLSAQQMGALVHLTAAQQHAPGSQPNSTALDWHPAIWGRQAAAAASAGALVRRPRTLPNATGRFLTQNSDALLPASAAAAVGHARGAMHANNQDGVLGEDGWGARNSRAVFNGSESKTFADVEQTMAPTHSGFADRMHAAHALGHSKRSAVSNTWTLPAATGKVVTLPHAGHALNSALHGINAWMQPQWSPSPIPHQPAELAHARKPPKSALKTTQNSPVLSRTKSSSPEMLHERTRTNLKSARWDSSPNASKHPQRPQVLPGGSGRVHDARSALVEVREVSLGQRSAPEATARAAPGGGLRPQLQKVNSRTSMQTPRRMKTSHAQRKPGPAAPVPASVAGSYASRVRDASSHSVPGSNNPLPAVHPAVDASYQDVRVPHASNIEINDVTQEEHQLEQELWRLTVNTQSRRGGDGRSASPDGSSRKHPGAPGFLRQNPSHQNSTAPKLKHSGGGSASGFDETKTPASENAVRSGIKTNETARNKGDGKVVRKQQQKVATGAPAASLKSTKAAVGAEGAGGLAGGSTDTGAVDYYEAESGRGESAAAETKASPKLKAPGRSRSGRKLPASTGRGASAVASRGNSSTGGRLVDGAPGKEGKRTGTTGEGKQASKRGGKQKAVVAVW